MIKRDSKPHMFFRKVPLSSRQLTILYYFILSTVLVFTFWPLVQSEPGGLNYAIHKTGETGWFLLVFLIYLGLLHKLFPKVQMLSQLLFLCKHVGLSVFAVIFSHFVIYLLLREQYMTSLSVLSYLSINLGTIAFILLVALACTSNQYCIQKWKSIHKIVHVVFVLAAMHIIMIVYGKESVIRYDVIILLSIYFIGHLIIWLKPKKRTSK